MKPIKFIAEVIAHRDLTDDVFEKTFRLVESRELKYSAGNYTSVRVADGKQPPVFRAYTFASCGSDPTTFKFCVKLFRTDSGEEGRGSGYLKNLKIGECAEFFGPAGEGSFVPRGKNSEPLFLLGTGTGIAPLVAVAKKLTCEKSPRPIHLFLGVSYPEDIFYIAEFEKIKKSNPNFNFCVAVSRPPEGFAGITGRLPAVLEGSKIPKNVEALVCGSEASVAGIKNKLLELGIPPNRIDAEGFGEV
ncbi:MAG: FAD-binding oxidoreductase [Patescibacteria group bacterium]